MDNIKKVYNSLYDKESKDIFLKKLMYNITADFCHVFDLVSSHVRTENDFQWHSFLKNISEISKEKRVVIYGAGGEGDMLCSILESYGIYVDAFCDRNAKLNGKKIKPVISPDQLLASYHERNDFCIVIGTEMFYKEIYDYLVKNQINKNDIFGGTAKFELQYFDEELISFSDREVFVDGGSLDLNTSCIFLRKCKNAEKVYAFEPDPNNYKKCLQVKQERELRQVEVYNFGLFDNNDELTFEQFDNGSSRISSSGNSKIQVVALDDILKDENITFIKMDIEGAELNALKGAANIIARLRPKLAISVYHRPNHMIDIPLYLKSLIPDYKLYLRHYSIYPQETILYAI
ncbi:MAG: FkbM family methyltransferase [Clostridiaceae bacterium]|nr:FkbM family methyltransferase [Clostridiaceae bacterium]